MHESVLWLSTKGKADKCKEILLDIADVNGKQLPPNFFDKFEVGAQAYVDYGGNGRGDFQRARWRE